MRHSPGIEVVATSAQKSGTFLISFLLLEHVVLNQVPSTLQSYLMILVCCFYSDGFATNQHDFLQDPSYVRTILIENWHA